jgi:hypothetical protein
MYLQLQSTYIRYLLLIFRMLMLFRQLSAFMRHDIRNYRTWDTSTHAGGSWGRNRAQLVINLHVAVNPKSGDKAITSR